MRHRNHTGRLSRHTGPRKALLRNLVEALLRYEKIRTTESRASEVRGFAERMITLGRDGSQAARRRAFAFLQHKESVTHLFEKIAPRFADRPGGYTRVVHTDPRPGDGAMMAFVELVDREIKVETPDEAKKKTRSQKIRDLRRAMARRH